MIFVRIPHGFIIASEGLIGDGMRGWPRAGAAAAGLLSGQLGMPVPRPIIPLLPKAETDQVAGDGKLHRPAAGSKRLCHHRQGWEIEVRRDRCEAHERAQDGKHTHCVPAGGRRRNRRYGSGLKGIHRRRCVAHSSCAVGRNRISFTSTSSGWLIAKATTRAKEAAGMANFS